MKGKIMNKRGRGKKLKGMTTPQVPILEIIVEEVEIFSSIPNIELDWAVETVLPLIIIHLSHSFIMQIYHSICMELICILHHLHHHHQTLNSKLNSRVYFSLLHHPHHLHSTIPISISMHITHLKVNISTVLTG
jgi:hypothetical protein